MPRRGKGGERAGGRGRGGSRPASFVTVNNAPRGNEASSRPHFSLSEEARNTERHHSWNSDLKLRHANVNFVSAGSSKAEDLTQISSNGIQDNSEYPQGSAEVIGQSPVEPLAKESPSHTPTIAPEIPLSNMSLNELDDVKQNTFNSDAVESVHRIEESSQKDTASTQPFFFDIKGSKDPVNTGFIPPIVRRSPSPAASDSSEEIILFAGRNASNSRFQQDRSSSKSPHKKLLSEEIRPSRGAVATIIEDSTGINLDGAASVPESSSQRLPNAARTVKSKPSRNNNSKPTIRKRGRVKNGRRSEEADHDAEVFADYIANTCDNEDLDGFARSSGLNQRDLGGPEDQWHDDEDLSVLEQQMTSAERGGDEWDVADLHDFDEISTSSEALDAIERVLSKRERKSGVQYLVVGRGCTMDDARWLSTTLLNNAGADGQIQLFEQEQAEVDLLFDSSEGSESDPMGDEELAMDLQDELDDIEDERDLEERRKDRMTDEQIARLLSKQEELGFGSSDLMLFDGEDFADQVMEETPLEGLRNSKVQTQTRTKRKKRYRDTFPSATLFADVLEQDPYNGFDVMDQERPSLRKRPKGRRGKLALELSDSDLEQAITMAWENDRTKKKIRKQEREELRAQGLLGKKDKVDMKAKYAEGMTIEDAKREIRVFLLSSMESLPLPPMAQKERKIVHEIAHIFNLKSKSIGGGTSRFPVLYKTARTIPYDEKALQSIDATLSSRRFLPRLDRARKRGVPTGKARGKPATIGISYRDGEVVGAAAPELGQENRGRAMLEKMGWSTGTALGALNNTRGLVQPVTQVVKTGKAGLG